VKHRLAVNPIACTGHGICAEMLPELIGLDEWGYPILAERDVPHELAALSRRAVRLCPTLALRLEASNAERRVPTGGPRDPAGPATRRGSDRSSGSRTAAAR
jgi:ferredoxin